MFWMFHSCVKGAAYNGRRHATVCYTSRLQWPTARPRTTSLFRCDKKSCYFVRRNHAGANISCLQARTCLKIRNPCLYIRKSVLEISTMFDHFCDIRASSITLMNMKSTLTLTISLYTSSPFYAQQIIILRVRLQRAMEASSHCIFPWSIFGFELHDPLLMFAFVHFEPLITLQSANWLPMSV